MIINKVFEQRNYSRKDEKGMCFCLSFNWIIFKILRPEHEFMDLDIPLTKNKSLDYNKEPGLVLMKPNCTYTGWAARAHRNDQFFIKAWGKSHNITHCTVHRVESIEDFYFSASDAYFIYCMYGTQSNNKFWGHAVAFSLSRRGQFFDCNCGQYVFEHGEHIGESIDNHCNTRYGEDGNIILDRYIYAIRCSSE